MSAQETPSKGLKGRRLVFDEKKGEFVEGKAKPALLDEELRRLPSELVTPKETEFAEKVHPEDPPHIRETLVDEFKAKIAKADAPLSKEEQIDEAFAAEALRFGVPDREARLSDAKITQERIDWIRFTTLRQKIRTAVDNVKLGLRPADQLAWVQNLQHLWFPTPDVRFCEVRERRAPSDVLRPAWLKGMALEVDVHTWPPRIVDLLALRGVKLPAFEEIKGEIEWAESLRAFYSEEDSDEAQV